MNGKLKTESKYENQHNDTSKTGNKDCSLTAHPLFPVEVLGLAAELESVFTTLKKITLG